MTTSLQFTLDPQSRADLPDLDHAPLAFGDQADVPHPGDVVSLAALRPHSFVVKERHFEYGEGGDLVITCHLTRASERSV